MVRLDAARTAQEFDELIDLVYTQSTPHLKAQFDPFQLTCEQFGACLRARGEALCIRLDGKLAGLCWVELRGELLFIHGLFVRAELRGRGAGAQALALLGDLYPQAASLELHVHRCNPRAQALYQREGFTVTGYDGKTGFYTMRKVLRSSGYHRRAPSFVGNRKD